MKKTVRLVLHVVLASVVFSHISVAAQQSPALTGKWQFSEGELVLTLELDGEGTGALNGDRFVYSVRGDKLIVEDDEGETSLYTFRLNGDSLVLSGGSLPRALTFKRAGGGKGLLERNLDPGRSPSQAERGRPGRRSEGGLVGFWRSDRANVQINDDGTLLINGARFKYSADDSYITITGEDGSARVRFRLNGDTLVTDYNGERTVYRRGAHSDDAALAERGSNSQEFVGKWCYMSNVNATNGGRMSNTCFTLYENGTYDYYSETTSSGEYGSSASQESDSGTWSVTGTTLTANSRSRGPLTFTLEKRNHPKTGDPMLVLDGDAFVTYSPRQPWP